VVENVSKILEQTFCRLLCKTKLHVTLVFDMVTCYVLLHNLLIIRKEINMDGVMNIFIIEIKIEQLWIMIKLTSHRQRIRNQSSTNLIKGQEVNEEKLKMQLKNFINKQRNLFWKRYIKCWMSMNYMIQMEVRFGYVEITKCWVSLNQMLQMELDLWKFTTWK
jgi:hypothetical protein